jgi:hypothetical protein
VHSRIHEEIMGKGTADKRKRAKGLWFRTRKSIVEGSGRRISEREI